MITNTALDVTILNTYLSSEDWKELHRWDRSVFPENCVFTMQAAHSDKQTLRSRLFYSINAGMGNSQDETVYNLWRGPRTQIAIVNSIAEAVRVVTEENDVHKRLQSLYNRYYWSVQEERDAHASKELETYLRFRRYRTALDGCSVLKGDEI